MLVSGLLFEETPTDAAFPGNNGLIAFERFAPIEIYTANSDGTDLRRLVEGHNPAWSADGKRLAFISTTGGDVRLMVSDADGADAIEIASEVSDVAWSPDGKKLAVCSWQSGTSELYTMDVDGTDTLQLTNHQYVFSGCASVDWSPDGGSIAYAASPAGLGEIRLISPDGSGERKVADGSAPSWSPDGQHLAFVDPTYSTGIYRVNVSTLETTWLADVGDQVGGGAAAWSPDGTMIAFLKWIPSGGIFGGNSVPYVMQADGGNQRMLLPEVLTAYNLNWQPLPIAVGPDLVWGDLDCSGDISPLDSLKLLRLDAGLNVPAPGGCPVGQDVLIAVTRLWGDFDCSGGVTPVDSLKLLRFDAGLSVESEVGCPSIGVAVTLVE